MENFSNPINAENLIPMLARHRRTAHRILNRSDLVEDVLQEALIAASKEDPKPANLEAWFYRTVVHRSLAARRAALRRIKNESSASEGTIRRDSWADPVRSLAAKELQAHIASAIRELPAEQREAFTLREYEGFDYQEIAEKQGVALGTVRSRLNRARLALRQHLSVYRKDCPQCERDRRKRAALSRQPVRTAS